MLPSPVVLWGRMEETTRADAYIDAAHHVTLTFSGACLLPAAGIGNVGFVRQDALASCSSDGITFIHTYL